MSVAAAPATATIGEGLPRAYAMGGSAAEARTDPTDMYFVSQAEIRNTRTAGGTAIGASAAKTPQAVATPFPPRNRSQTGYTWPTIAASPATADVALDPFNRSARSTLAAPFAISSSATSTPAGTPAARRTLVAQRFP